MNHPLNYAFHGYSLLPVVINGLGIHIGPAINPLSSGNTPSALSVELNHNIRSGKNPQHLETAEAEHLPMTLVARTHIRILVPHMLFGNM